MPDRDLNPKLGRIRSPSARKKKTWIGRVVREMRRAGNTSRSMRHSTWFGSRNGRGYAVSCSFASRAPQPRRRRVVVKARITKFGAGGIKAAQSHLRYLRRDGVTKEGERGSLYNSRSEQVDGKAFLEEARGDRHQFRLIVAPEDSSQLTDLKPFVRDLMQQAEIDLGTKLDWVAVDHFNTGHPHTHIVIRGKDETGQDLIIARDYIARGFRERANDLMTLELGLETQAEFDRKLDAEMTADRFTRIDRSLLRDTADGVLVVGRRQDTDQRWQSLKTGRLRKLENMGLSEELSPGIWKIAERAETVLRDLGRRGDIMRTMQGVLKHAGIERGTTDFSIFRADDPSARTVGKIVGIGLADEMNDRHYVLVDGIDGKLHYAEIGRIDEADPPSRGVLATLRGRQQHGQSAGRHFLQARIFIESHARVEQLATASGATWLDRQLVLRGPEEIAQRGFGLEVTKALRHRQQWLVQKGLMREKDGQLIARQRMLAELERRDIETAGSNLESKLGLKRVTAKDFGRTGRTPVQSVRLVSGRFAVMKSSKEFTLVPWRQVAQMRRRSGIVMEARKEISL
ncbi:DUF3363 domain-containing protein [Nitratireductor sp. XY-223]|uniref:DUF3363 domain-containing protein n=1 Tax=Hyphomicrobiales TaxID=356 RepID=UPI0010A9C9D6|nr:DUF3363 domain-containing protein [Nitratireductor sp. XY-223]